MIEVLRIGHRPGRDKRVTTHVALVARAFGAGGIYIPGGDDKLKRTLQTVVDRFGGEFNIDIRRPAKSLFADYKGLKVHLTMYGSELLSSIEKIKNTVQFASRDEMDTDGDILIIVGAEKVPRYVYDMSDFNVSVGNQPHSEIAALAVFLDRLTKGGWLEMRFQGEVEIIPDERGKNVVDSRYDQIG